MNEYLTITEISKLSPIYPSIRTLQRKAKKKLIDNPLKYRNLITIINDKYCIHNTIINEFEPIYKKALVKPKEHIITQFDWDLFADFVPTDETPIDVLIAIMEYLFEYLKTQTNKALKMYYVIEQQPKAGKHVHYFIKTDDEQFYILYLIEKRVEILNLCEQYNVPFKNNIKLYATSYLNKGKTINYKGATLLHSQLLIAGNRKN